MHDVEQRVAAVRERMAAAAARAGRDAREIELLAISKTHPPARVQHAVDAGVTALGENRVQEAESKIPAIHGPVRWHLVGSLQSNKTRKAAAIFDAVHSVDGVKLARRLDQACSDLGKRLAVYVQVEYVRHGGTVAEAEDTALATATAVAEAEALDLVGLMTLPPFDPEPQSARPWFARLRDLRDRLGAQGLDAPGLSMGMSNDFEVAIEEGATIVRIGSTIFGSRH